MNIKFWQFFNNDNKSDEINEDGITPYSPQSRVEMNYVEEDLRQELVKKNETINMMKGELDELKEGFGRVKEECDREKENYQKLEDEYSREKTNATNETKSLKAKLKKEKQEFDSKLRDLEDKANHYQKNYNELKRNNEELKSQKKHIEQQNMKVTKSLNAKLGNYEKEKQESDSKLKVLEDKVNYYQKICNELKRNNEELVSQRQHMEQDMERNIGNLEQHMKEQRRNFEKKFQQAQETYKKNIDALRQKLSEKGSGLRELEEKNAKLKEEASKYQSALGSATNTRLGDDDQNNSVKLKKDILLLQNMLENYVTHLKPNIDVDIELVQTLAQEYGCFNKITIENPNKLFIKAILQRKVLEAIYNYSHELSKYSDKDFALELNVESKANELLSLIKTFSTTRVGTDQVINTTAIKIRQQVYGILGNRGFNNIIRSDGEIYAHNLINYAAYELNKMMNRYRKINDVDRKEQVEAMAPKLIQDIYKLFWFRVNVQEPTTETHFFELGDRIDPNTMKGMWNDDEIDRSYVDICYFPLVGRNLTSSNRKIYTPAKVFPHEINHEDETRI